MTLMKTLLLSTSQRNIYKYSKDKKKRKKVVGSTIEQKEISDIQEMALKEIPEVLMKYPENEGEYHPSSYLRLLMFYLYKNGYKRTCKEFVRRGRKMHNQVRGKNEE